MQQKNTINFIYSIFSIIIIGFFAKKYETILIFNYYSEKSFNTYILVIISMCLFFHLLQTIFFKKGE